MTRTIGKVYIEPGLSASLPRWLSSVGAAGHRGQPLTASLRPFAGRVLAFDAAAAQAFASIAAERRRKGRPTRTFDAQIGAIARSRGAALATRNVADFQDCGHHQPMGNLTPALTQYGCVDACWHAAERRSALRKRADVVGQSSRQGSLG